MTEVSQQDKEELKRKSFFGVAALTSRTFVLQVVGAVATFILTIILDPGIFGVFIVISAVVSFLNYFSDIGLAAALVQKKEEPSREELVTTFTIQQLLVGIGLILALVLSPRIVEFYHLGATGLFLFRSLVVAFFLSSLKTIPSIILERKLDFQKLVIPQIVETIVFYLMAIVLALKGWGIASFAWAALLRGFTGTALLYMIAPWRPGIGFTKASARHLLSYGVPYQANSLIALLKDDLLIIFLGKILPFTAVGYIGWAKKWSEIALRLVMDNVIRVTFPTYARLQHEAALLAKAIQKSLLFLSLLSFPIAVGMMFMIRPTIAVVPRYAQWEPAVFSFYLFTISAVLATLSSPLVNALNAIGKVRYTFTMMVVWTVLTWVLVPPLVRLNGYNGVAIAAVIISITSFLPIYIIRRFVNFSFLPQLVKPALASGIMALALWSLTVLVSSSTVQLLLGIPLGITVYGAAIYLLLGDEIRPYFILLLHKSA